MAKRYIVHPGNVTLISTGATVFVDAGTLASYYGLSGGDYDTATTGSQQETSNDGRTMHIHLFPRPDGAYRNIKTVTGDNGTDSHYDIMVNAKKHRAERAKEIGL